MTVYDHGHQKHPKGHTEHNLCLIVRQGNEAVGFSGGTRVMLMTTEVELVGYVWLVGYVSSSWLCSITYTMQ